MLKQILTLGLLINSSLLSWHPVSSQTLTLHSHLSIWPWKNKGNTGNWTHDPTFWSLPLFHQAIASSLFPCKPDAMPSEKINERSNQFNPHLTVFISSSFLPWQPICLIYLNLGYKNKETAREWTYDPVIQDATLCYWTRGAYIFSCEQILSCSWQPIWSQTLTSVSLSSVSVIKK